MPNAASKASLTSDQFVARVLLIVVVAAVMLAAWRLADVALLLFGAVLLAIGLGAAANLLATLSGIRRSAALSIVVALVVAVAAGVGWFFGSVVADQFADVLREIPAGLDALSEWLRAHRYGRQVLVQAQGFDLSSITGSVAVAVGVVARLLTRAIGYGGLMFVVAIYLAAQPRLYRHITLRLVPAACRPLTERLFDRSDEMLKRWLLGQMLVMLTIGTLSGLGLWALGVEAAFALGLIGGLLTFIPYVGAVLAAVPAVLVALAHAGVAKGFWVILMYVGAHAIEGNFITPLVQAEATALPPVFALLSTVAFSILFGPSAVLLAAPLKLFLMVAVEVLYVEHALGEPSQLHLGSTLELAANS